MVGARFSQLVDDTLRCCGFKLFSSDSESSRAFLFIDCCVADVIVVELLSCAVFYCRMGHTHSWVKSSSLGLPRVVRCLTPVP